MKILVIDDSRLHRLALRRSLGHAGHEVSTAGDGEEGLRLACENTPDLIILDMMLPRISGIDVLRKLRLEPKTSRTPVLVLTGLSEKNRNKLIEEGASGYIEKTQELLTGESVRVLLSAITYAGASVQ